MKLARIATAFKRILFPSRCRACGGLFHPPAEEGSVFAPGNADFFRSGMGSFLCPTCTEGFLPAASPLCPACGEVFPAREGEDHLCGPCIRTPRKFCKARAVGVYKMGLLKAVHCLKYKGRIELARPLGSLLFAGFRQHWHPEDIDLVLPVPLHPKRMRMRGFNQSLLLVQGWPNRLKSEGFGTDRAVISPELLKRSKPTLPQTGLGREKRMKNLRGAFTIKDSGKVKGRRILLVDDVYTTGATADACTGALLRAGAARVDVLTLARTMGK